MKIGTLVRQTLFSQTVNKEHPTPVSRYGIVLSQWEIPHKTSRDCSYYRVLWQPSKKFPVYKGSGYVDIVAVSKLEIVNEPTKGGSTDGKRRLGEDKNS